MKIFSFTFCILFFFIFHCPLFAQQRGVEIVQVTIEGSSTTLYKQSHALLIGVSTYTNGLPSLPGVAQDIQAVKAALENNGFDTRVVMNPDNVALTRAFNEFIADFGQEPDNRLLFYFAGHGYTQKMPYGDDIGYILPANCPNPEKNQKTIQGIAMPMGQIEIFAQQIRSKHALFLFDACFSGAIFAPSRDIPGIISYKTSLPVRQFITSGSADETVPDKSIFRQQFIHALQGEADANNDGYLTGTELGDFLQSTVVNYSKNSQHPQFGKIRNPNLDKGDFIFVLKSPSRPTPLPTVYPVTVEEKALITYGKLEVTTEITGSLYIDENYIKNLNANTVVTLDNIPSGAHRVIIKGEETIEKQVEISSGLTYHVTFEKNKHAVREDLPEMVLVERGTFQMGSNSGNEEEKPAHTVTLSSFYIGKYEVTQKQWKEIMGDNPSRFNDCDNCPVENVNWNAIQEFLRKLNTKTGKNYRLPTEAEWEYAARGGNKSRGYKYSGNDNPDSVAWYYEVSGFKTHPVGQKLPNELGLYDMSGNVWEWCNDWYNDKWYGSSPYNDPKGPGDGTIRVLRGGSWYIFPGDLRTTSRRGFYPNGDFLGRSGGLGFRLSMTYGLYEMVLVEGGTFQMGSNDGRDDEKPVHAVSVPTFYMGKYEVTQKLWQEIMGNNPSGLKNCDNCPVENVSWDDIREFLRKLNAKTGKNYQLPTEAEWEYAARGGNKSRNYKYSGSDNPDSVAWYGYNSDSKIHPVGQKQPNELGLYDMSGNVWEWCSDWYNGNYYNSSPSLDPKGPDEGINRIMRGCSYHGTTDCLRTAFRFGSGPEGCGDCSVGFRIVRN